MKFGRLLVLERTHDYVTPSGGRRPRYRCLCDCGNEKVVVGSNLLRGTTTSCGCFQRENMSALKKKHGGWAAKEKLFGVWCGIRKRCLSPNSHNYNNYGKRGIYICDSWKDSYEAFREWAYMNGYKQGLSIDRIDNDSGYSPDNCRWTTPITQQNNRRSNINITYQSQTRTLSEWARLRNINYQTLYRRYKCGWSTPKMLNFTD